MRLEHEENETLTTMLGRYKSRSDNVSYEDLLEISEQRQQVKVIQRLFTDVEVIGSSCFRYTNQPQLIYSHVEWDTVSPKISVASQ